MLLEEGADVNSMTDGLSPLMQAARCGGNPKISKALATFPGVMIDAQASVHVMCFVVFACLNGIEFRICYQK